MEILAFKHYFQQEKIHTLLQRSSTWTQTPSICLPCRLEWTDCQESYRTLGTGQPRSQDLKETQFLSRRTNFEIKEIYIQYLTMLWGLNVGQGEDLSNDCVWLPPEMCDHSDKNSFTVAKKFTLTRARANPPIHHNGQIIHHKQIKS